MYSTYGEPLATCCMHQSLQGNTYCYIHKNPYEPYLRVHWDSAVGGMELELAFLLCSYRHHNELLDLQFADPVWAIRS